VLSARHLPLSRRELELKLECSRATVKRLIEDLRGYGIPIRYDRPRNGYVLDRSQTYELPGIWFNASELYALLAAQHLLENAEPGLLGDMLAPLKRKIEQILAADHLGAGELSKRVRILRMGGRGLKRRCRAGNIQGDHSRSLQTGRAWIETPLTRGVGSAKAFGCGLMLVRRI
jgi:biotin operon repressor